MSSSMEPKKRHARAATIALIAALALTGCSQGPGGERLENRPPNVWLSSAPPAGSESHYKVHIFWGGWDPDGEIAYYEFVITDNEDGIFDPADTTTTEDGVSPWRKVFANDSVFTFSADVMADSTAQEMVTRFERSHTFFIRAVDRQGIPSLEPEYRSFTAWTLSPSVSITVPRQSGLAPAIVPPRATYRWKALDYVQELDEPQEPDSVRYILKEVASDHFADAVEYVRTHPHCGQWSPWLDYRAPGDSGKFWTTEVVDPGNYVFAVQAKDEAGAVTPVFDERHNVRRLTVDRPDTGPLLQVYNPYVGTVRTTVASTPVVIVDLPANVPIQFRWTADADSYAGIVTGYRYGWDVNDLDDPRQWAIDFTPFPSGRESAASSPPKVFHFGSHTFNVEVTDNNGLKSRVEIKVNVFAFTMEKPLLMVDDFEPNSPGLHLTNGEVPNDEEHDAFWDYVLGDVVGYSPAVDAISVRSGYPTPGLKLAQYKSIIWDVQGGHDLNWNVRPKFFDLVRFLPKDWSPSAGVKVEPNFLLLFLRAGGHLMVCGHQPLTQVLPLSWIGPRLRFPVILKYESPGDQDGNYVDQIQSGNAIGDETHAYRDACVNVLDVAYFNRPGNLRTRYESCAVDKLRSEDRRTEGLREMLPLDPRFPRLDLRREVAGPGLSYAEDVKGLSSEMYNPPYFAFCGVAELQLQRPCFEPIYGHGCLDEASPLFNAPVAFWSSTYADITPDEEGGVPARSVYFGVEPFYFEPSQVKEMMEIILFDEWELHQQPAN